MSDIVNILAQLVPPATTETVLYTVPSGRNSLLSELVVCNRGGAASTFRMSISLAGGATQTKDYIYFDLSLPANNTFSNEMGVTIRAGDVVRVFASSVNLTFTLFGAVS